MTELVTDDGVRLHYTSRGSGPVTLIYLHWMGGQSRGWESLWHHLTSPALRHVALDFRGHGRSDRQPSTFTNERLGLDVLQLADALGISKFVVVGQSFGGKIAIKVAQLAPGRVAGMVLMGAVGPGKVLLERDAVEAILSRAGDIAFVRECFRPWLKVWPRDELDRWLEDFSRTPDWVHRAVCEIALWTDMSSEITRLVAPALVIAGEHDPVYGPEYQRTSVLPYVSQAALVTIDCGHGLVMERPQEIAVSLKTFLARHG